MVGSNQNNEENPIKEEIAKVEEKHAEIDNSKENDGHDANYSEDQEVVHASQKVNQDDNENQESNIDSSNDHQNLEGEKNHSQL